MRETAASISSRLMRSPSGIPRLNAIPALVVASALKPASTKILALPASHAFGSTSMGPSTWSRRRLSAFSFTRYLIRSLSGVKAHAACCPRASFVAAAGVRFAARQAAGGRRALVRGARAGPRDRVRETGAEHPGLRPGRRRGRAVGVVGGIRLRGRRGEAPRDARDAVPDRQRVEVADGGRGRPAVRNR